MVFYIFYFFRVKKIVCYAERFVIWRFVISSITVAIFVRASAVEFKLSQVKLSNTDKLV